MIKKKIQIGEREERVRHIASQKQMTCALPPPRHVSH
jgi:hypothetical protein